MSDMANQAQRSSAHVSTKESYFDGGVWSRIGWTILYSLLRTITLDIARPAAECMLLRWQCNHTVINGRRLKFTGTGAQLFGKYILWWFLRLITFGIYGLWMGINMKKWTIKHTVYEDDTSGATSRYTAGIIGFFGMRLLAGFLTAISFGIAYPWAHRMLLSWDISHTYISGTRLEFIGTGGGLLGRLMLWNLLTLVTFSIFYWFVRPIKYLKWVCMHIKATPVSKVPNANKNGLKVIAVMLAAMILFGGLSALLVSLVPFDKLAEIEQSTLTSAQLPAWVTSVIPEAWLQSVLNGDAPQGNIDNLPADEGDPSEPTEEILQAPNLQQLRGYYISSQDLQNLSTVREHIAVMSPDDAIMIEIKDECGQFTYPTTLSDRYAEGVDAEGVLALIQELQAEGRYIIAKVTALQDDYFPIENVSAGLLSQNGYYLICDAQHHYWLDPTSELTQQYLLDIANELKSLGFDEVVFDEMTMPSYHYNYIFEGDPSESVIALSEILATVADDSFCVSFVNDDEIWDAPNNYCRIYMHNVDGTDLMSLQTWVGVDDLETQLVCWVDQPYWQFDDRSHIYPMTELSEMTPTGFAFECSELTFHYTGSYFLHRGNLDPSLITWYSDDASVATIEDGFVTAVGEGTTTVYGEYNGRVVSCIIRCDFED